MATPDVLPIRSPANALITPDKIRMFMMDRCAADNYLLDAREFDDAQISFAFELMVDQYNTIPPILPSYLQTVENFKFRAQGLLGIAAILLRTKAINMERNRLQGTGQIVDDKQNAEAYLKLAQMFQSDFERQVRILKADININGSASYFRLGGALETRYGWL